jgi:hypothetical protein
LAHRRGKMGIRPSGPGAPMGFPPARLTGARSRPVEGWEPPGGSVTLASAIARNMQLSTMLGSSWNASTAHGTGHNVHRSGALVSPQTFVKMTTQGGPNTIENIQPTAAPIRIARRALSRNRGRPGIA